MGVVLDELVASFGFSASNSSITMYLKIDKDAFDLLSGYILLIYFNVDPGFE